MATAGKCGQNEGTCYQRKDGRWEAAMTIATVDGKSKRKSFYGRTKADAMRQMRAAQREHEAGLPVPTGRQTVAQFLDRWLAEVVQPTVRPKTHHSYAQLVRLHVKPALGHYQLAKLEPQHVQSFMNEKLAVGLSPRTVQYLRAVLRRALGQALKWGLVARNVATLVDPPRSVRHEIKPLTPVQAQTFLTAARGDRLEALYSVALALGLRQGEALGLRWSDVDLDAGTLVVRVALQRVGGKPQLVEPKTSRSRRTIPMPPTIVAALRAHKVRQLEERLLAGRRWDDSWGLVFASTIGTPLDARNVIRQFHRMLQVARLAPMRFHDLRHTCASLLLAQGVGPRTIMEVLGHSQISLTMDTYSHVMPEMRREAADLMERLLTASA
ncbi:MAG: site-specific integrase [Chloroflexota bacterium]|nr:site-specific integrase [Chloroflexota bacterium]